MIDVRDYGDVADVHKASGGLADAALYSDGPAPRKANFRLMLNHPLANAAKSGAADPVHQPAQESLALRDLVEGDPFVGLVCLLD